MKYENARDLLPEHLLRQVQKYISGKLVYVPARERKRKWGSSSGYRQYLQERNEQIRKRFASGEAIQVLADAFHLSCESIKRIVYTRKEMTQMEYRCALSSAVQWADRGMLEEWVHAYLLSDGHNKPFSDGLKIVDRFFLGPVRMPIALFHRCTGPEEEMKYRIPDDAWENGVRKAVETIASNPDIAPLIVHYYIPEGKTDGLFELNDGNHRWEAYHRLGIEDVFVIVWITDGDELEQFQKRFGA